MNWALRYELWDTAFFGIGGGVRAWCFANSGNLRLLGVEIFALKEGKEVFRVDKVLPMGADAGIGVYSLWENKLRRSSFSF